MKKIITLALILLGGVVSQAQEVEWMSMNEALEAQKKDPKKIMMDAYTTWCGPCKMLDRNTFSHPEVAAYINENYYPVKFNAEGNEEVIYEKQSFGNPNFDPNRTGRNSQHQFATALNISGYPSIVFFDEEGKLIAPIVGYKSPQQLEMYLKMFSNDDYKGLTSREAFIEYQQNFEGSFTN